MKTETRYSETRMILTVLLVVFVVLKLTGLVDWSWWIVLAPFWGPLVIAAIGLVILAVAIVLNRRTR